MAARLPCFEDHALTLKAAGVISLLAHGALLGALAWIFPRPPALPKDDGVVIELACVASAPARENAKLDPNPPSGLPHSPLLANVAPQTESDSGPVAKSKPLPAKKTKRERPARALAKAQTRPASPSGYTPAQPKPAAPSAPVKEPSNPRTVYPELARKRGQEGIARVRCEINAAGIVTNASLAQSSGHRLLDEAALKTVRKWRFKPALSNGQAVAGNVIVPVEFRLK